MRRQRESETRARFEQLFRATRADILAYLMRRSESPEEAADLLAETYLIAWRRIDALPKGDPARLWLFGVARNLLLKGADRRRSSNALAECLAHELRRAQPAQEPSGDDERREIVRAALRALPERDREIVILAAWEELSPKEIATIIGVSANVVRVRLHRARRRLRRELESADLSSGPRSAWSWTPSARRSSLDG